MSAYLRELEREQRFEHYGRDLGEVGPDGRFLLRLIAAAGEGGMLLHDDDLFRDVFGRAPPHLLIFRAHFVEILTHENPIRLGLTARGHEALAIIDEWEDLHL